LRVMTGTTIRTDRKRRHSTDSSDSASSVELQVSSTIRPPTVPPPTPINWMLLQVPTLPLYEHSDFLFQILHTNCLFLPVVRTGGALQARQLFKLPRGPCRGNGGGCGRGCSSLRWFQEG
jgi:hypothetical protein